MVSNLKLLSRIVLLLVGVAALFSYAMFQGGFVSWFLFYSFIPFLLYALFLAIYPLRLWKIERVINQQILEAGDNLSVNLTITRKLPFPLYFLIIEEKMASSINENNIKLVRFPLFKRKITVPYEVHRLPRGEHTFTEIQIQTADFLGLIKKHWTYPKVDSIIVYPKLEQIVVPSLKNSFGDGTIARGLDYRNDSMVSTGVREYQPGDRLSWINWKLTASKNNPMTKEFEKTESEHIVICLDRYCNIHSVIFEKMVRFTASLTNELCKTNIPVGLFSIGREETIFPVKVANACKDQLFYHLAIVKNDCLMTVGHVLQNKKQMIPPRSTVVLVTAEIREDLKEIANHFASHQNKVVIFAAITEGIETTNQSYSSSQKILVKGMDDCFVTQATRGETK